MADPTFTDRMQVLVASELADAHCDADRLAEAIERVTSALALIIATACKGHPQTTNDMVEGVCAHLMERVVDQAPLARFMAGMKQWPRA